jgi:hypothetical protein
MLQRKGGEEWIWGIYFFALRTCRDFSSIVVVVHERRRRRGRGIDKARQ